MKFEDLVKQRRSIRQYSSEEPKENDIQKILEAGTWAPSGLNNQPWKFSVIKDKKRKEGLSKFTKYGESIKSAPIVICVFLDNGTTYNREKDIMSAGACIQNMLLQAYELGLGTCWLGEILNKREEVEKYLETASDYELVAVVTLGYSDEEITEGCRKNIKSFLI